MNHLIEQYLTGADKRIRREKHWVGIIIHHTGVGGRKKIDEKLWRKLYVNLSNYLAKKDKNYVSCHYTIGRNGEITQIVDDRKFEAWHAGKSVYWNPISRRVCNDWNRHGVGIELIGDGNLHKYSAEQYESLINLCAELIERHPTIHPLAIVGHEHIAPNRKSDPGKYFNWTYFYQRLFAIAKFGTNVG